MILPENIPDINQIILFLNNKIFLGGIILIAIVFSIVIALILLYHWGKYRARGAVRLEEGEEIVKIFRKHWFSFLIDFVFLIALAFIPLLISFLPKEWLVWLEQVKGLLDILYIVWLDFIFFAILIVGTNYFLDTWILTNKRIIDVEQKSLFRRDIAELRLENIQDIKMEVLGFINSLLGIGNVYVESAGATREFVIRNVARPEDVRNTISDIQRKKMEEVKKVEVVG
ncbi:hypothetical protein A2645_02285 [Candidatus Nomurabacteria bacterium RIFCSPHIGHO2_01_FULL_39_9]|uniref:YdbS-like PH domain-containing protein n=1 Tax=Candidatus Nomurabacteria bacterium RIFCSPHIGHO2_01_FULL_39_9 TaxID=1801735 RepID=A0A1F6UV75_9BACT|nr:MAG: hypothetical protein A2645_02285 [Candidatus Nomurabacteria bacterium RIFCSPHIGHO2_01_FULL_39_9]